MPMLAKRAGVKRVKQAKLLKLVRPSNKKQRPKRKLRRQPPIKVRSARRLPPTQL